MGGCMQTIFGAVGVDITKQFGGCAALVTADAKAHDITVLVTHCRFRHLSRPVDAKMADRIKNPEYGYIKVALPALASALQSFEDGVEIQLPVKTDAHRHVDLGMHDEIGRASCRGRVEMVQEAV